MFSRDGGTTRVLALVAIVLAAILAFATAYLFLATPGNVNNADVEFDERAPTIETPAPEGTGGQPSGDAFHWPFYGLTAQRTKYLPLKRKLKPPFVERWRMTGRILLEFTRSLCGRRLFLLKNNGALYGLSRQTGKILWKRKLGYLAASSPACNEKTVYAVLLSRRKGVNAGRVVAVSSTSGRTIWSRNLASRSESSPLLLDGRLYFGSENGTIYNLRARDGQVRWKTRNGGAVKGGLAADGGRLFYGDYSGAVTAIDRGTGKRVWRTGTSGGRFGLSSGTFYGTPAIAYGRLYIGNTDGFAYSFGLRSGKLAWRHKTGGYVYSSPAVSDAQGGTVFIGSYDRSIYALNARSGAVRWRHRTKGRVVGGPAVIGNLVFYSDLGATATYALGVNTGKMLWSVDRGAFNPVISDGTRIYLNGYSSLYMYTERGRRPDGSLTTAGRKRIAALALARAAERRQRYVGRRVEQRRQAVREASRLRRAGTKVCFRSNGKTVCRVPRPVVCFQPQDGRVVCRARAARKR